MRDHDACEEAIAAALAAGKTGKAEFLAARCDLKHSHLRDDDHVTPIRDSTEELLAFGALLGMRPEWLQHPGTHREHFDLTENKRAEAMRLGAAGISYPAGTGELLMQRRDQCRCESLPTCHWSEVTTAATPATTAGGERVVGEEGA